MNCNLKIDKQRKLRVLVARDLMDIVQQNQTFDLKEYTRSIYNLIHSKTNDHAKALDYAMLVPLFVDQLSSLDLEIKGALRKNKFSFDTLADLLLQLNTPDTTISTIENFLELNTNVVNDLKVISEQVNTPEPVTNVTEDIEPEPQVVQGRTPITRIDVKPARTKDDTFEAAPPTVFADIFFEALSPNVESSGYNVPSEKPFVQLQAKVKRYILSELMKAGVDYQSSKMNIPGYGAVYLTMMNSSRIPEDSRDPSAPAGSHDKGVSLVLTNRYGDHILFDEATGQPDTRGIGKVVYFNVRKTDSVIDEQGNVKQLSSEDMDRAKSLARRIKVGKEYTSAELSGAVEQIKSELKVIHQMRQAVLANKETTIRNEITGGSLGYINYDWNIRNKTNTIDFGSSAFNPKKYPETKGLDPFSHYFTVDTLYDKKVRLERGNIKDSGLTDILASVIVDPIVLSSKTGTLVPISKEERDSIISTYLYTNADGIQVFTDTLQKIRIKGTYYPVSTAEERAVAKLKVLEYFNTPKVFKNIQEYPKMNIKDSLVNTVNFNRIDSVTANEDGTVTLAFKKDSYLDFLKNNTFINYELNAQKQLVRLNPYFTFSPAEGQLDNILPNIDQEIVDDSLKVSVPDSSLTDKTAADKEMEDLMKSVWDNPEFQKNLDQKNANKQATTKQIADAKAWYEKSPLNAYFPFEAVFNVINTKTPRAAATWTMNGITLFKGSDYSDLYHEAFHGFTQAFLSQENKVKLYSEARKKTGTFTDYNGRTVSFAKATDLQLEEYLAEDFREYMLKGQTAKEAEPARNNIFRRIFNFLKALFEGLTVDNVVENDRANAYINELYEKLRVGNLSEYTFAQENVSFGELNTGVRPFSKTSELDPLNYQDSMSIVRTVDSLISEFVDRLNAGLTPSEITELAQVEAKLAANTLPVSERKRFKERLAVLEAKKTYQYTSTLLKTQTGLKKAYRYVQIRLGALQIELVDKLATVTDPNEQASLTKSIQNLHYALSNFGDVNDLSNNKPDKENNILGVIAYHGYKSAILEPEKVAAIFEEDNIVEDENFVASRDGIDRLGNASSMKDLASKEILTLLHTLYKKDKNGNTVLNQYGVPEITEFKEVWNRLVRMLSGHTATEMEQIIQAEIPDYPAFGQLLNKLGPLRTGSVTENGLWTSFWRTFNPTKVPLIQVTVNKVIRRDKDDNLEIFYETNIGEATGEYRKIGRDWENNFKTDHNNPYTLTDDNGTFLNIDKVLKDFSADTLSEKRFEFFRALGFELSDKKEIRKALNEKNIGGAKYYREKLSYLKENNIPVRRFADLNNEYVFAKGKSDSLASRYSDLQELEIRYSDRYANTMVSTATGNSQSEYTLNSTLTQLVNKLNAAVSYQDLISRIETSHYDIMRNPLIKASTWMNSLFKMDLPKNDPEYGKRRRTSNSQDAPFVQLELSNLSGVLFTINGETTGNGVESAKADPFTKMIMDFHLMIQSSHPELLRHSDKSTSYSTVLSHIFTNGTFKDNYISNMSFFKGTYQDEALGILLPHIAAELERVNIMRNPAANGIDSNFDQTYVKRGSNFVAFDKMLSAETKELLYALPVGFDLNTAPVELMAAINTDITAFFAEQTKTLNKRFNEANFVADRLMNQLSGTIDNVTHGKFPKAQIQPTLIRSMVYNTWIHNMESMVVLYGDIALYNVAKDDLHKRIAGIGSTGLLARTDDAHKDFVNTILTRDYAKKLQVKDIKGYDGTFASAVIQDKKTTSAYIAEQEELLGTEGAVKYRGMDEGDAMGWIAFDSYRILKASQGQWLPAHEELYQNIVNGKRVDQARVREIFFPTMKAQYFGPLHTAGLPVTAFHKFQLFPLIPSVLENSPMLKALHDKMTNEQVDYVLFKSGSKVGTLTTGDQVDDIYGDTRQLSSAPFTKNNIFIDYLKDQLEIGSQYKGKVTFPTQLRTLVEEGMMQDGIPVDYTGSLEVWNQLSEAGKRDASPKYKLLRSFENNIAALTEFKKKELLKKANWTINDKGQLEGNVDDLVKFIKGELTRLDMGDHEVDFLQVNNGKMKFDLSIAPFAENIEKLLNNIVTKELINQKVTGEALVQVSGAMFESAASMNRDYKNPTAEDLTKWGSNDLPFYHKGTDGKTKAMKVKIALQGEFRKLLQLKDKRGYQIGSIKELNRLLKDEEWLNTGDNRRMITMVGVRIPVQGLNSMEFMEVYEFLPEIAGNIIIPPSEIVGKSGSDFDIDKLTVMMPSFRREQDTFGLHRQQDLKATKDLFEKYKAYRIAKAKEVSSGRRQSELEPIGPYDSLMYTIFGFSAEELDEELLLMLQEEKKAFTLEEFHENINGSKAIENDLLWDIKSILEQPSNYANLVRPNDTDIAMAVADEMRTLIPAYSKRQITGSEVLGYEFNLNKHASNNAGKATLGIGAVGNKWNPLFNRVGAYLNPSAGITLAQKEKIEAKGKKASWAEKKLLKSYRRQKLFLPHHTKVIGKEEGISLSGLMDVNNENRISDVISQMMNGWLDVAKDDWIFYIQGNEEITPSIEFLLEAGVPFKTAIYLVSLPMVRDYVKEQQLATSTFADALGKAPDNPNKARNKARAAILNNPVYGFDMAVSEAKVNSIFPKEAESRISKVLGDEKFFDPAKLRARIEAAPGKYDEYQRAAFLHFLEIEEMAGAMRDIKLRMNADTSKSGTLYEAQNKAGLIQDLMQDARIPKQILTSIMNESPISSFFIQEFQLDIWGPLFTLRNHKAVRSFLNENARREDITDTFGDKETFNKEFANDLVSYIFQNSMNRFNLKTITDYRGLPVQEDLKQTTPIVITDGVIKVNKPLLLTKYNPADPIFPTRKEFLKYSFERAYLENTIPYDKVKETLEYRIKRDLIVDKIKPLASETEAAFKERREDRIYKLFIQNKALDNTNNMHKLFIGRETFASQFAVIRRLYPQLAESFDLVKQLSLSEAKTRVNLRLNDTKLDGDAINLYHENLLNLADPQIKKVQDPEANQYISEFFGRFATVAYLQSGLSTKNAFSLGRIVPTQHIQMLIDEASKAYVKHFDAAQKAEKEPAILSDFYMKFVAKNRDYSGRVRGKNYVSNATLQASIDLLKGKEPETPVAYIPEMVVETDDTTSETITDLKQYINYSGGATGSDTEWAEVGKEFGIGKQVDYKPETLSNLNAEQLREVEEAYTKVVKTLGRKKLSIDSYSGKLVRRDYLQAKAADAIFAIVQDFDNNGYVQGGTAYAVVSALNMGKPVYVFNQAEGFWYSADYDTQGNFENWTSTATPILTPKFAGIGTREINDDGRKAIRDVYEKTRTSKSTFARIAPRVQQLNLFEAPTLQTSFVKTIRVINDTDVAAFKTYLQKTGKQPKEFFTSTTQFKEFFNPQTGKRENAPQSSKWVLNDNGYYDLVDKEGGEVYLSNVDLGSGYKIDLGPSANDIEELPCFG